MSEEKNNYMGVCTRCEQTKHLIRQAIERLKTAESDVSIEMVAIKIKHKALYDLMNQVGSRSPEKGGVFVGPVGRDYITDFYFDHSATSTGGTYAPDYLTINRILHEHWEPAGLEIKGIAHSHPGNLDSLTYADLSYIKRLMVSNPHMKTFVAPVVLPHHYAVRPLVVSRDQMNRAQQAYFEIVD
jgi:proteasome lid subunit RPN8/RPN11